jgi:DNA-binding transcriptional ArsR family regulator
MRHPVMALDEVVHQRTRLGILAILAEVSRAEFNALKDALDLSQGNLSSHLRVLEEAGYVRVDKGYEGRRPRTWLAITKAGHDAYGHELTVLSTLVRQGGDTTEANSWADTARPRRSRLSRPTPSLSKVAPKVAR